MTGPWAGFSLIFTAATTPSRRLDRCTARIGIVRYVISLRRCACTRFLGLACLAALVGLVGLAHADNHHNAHGLLGKKLNTNGKHVLHTTGEHTAHAHVKGGKVANVEVIHKTRTP